MFRQDRGRAALADRTERIFDRCHFDDRGSRTIPPILAGQRPTAQQNDWALDEFVECHMIVAREAMAWRHHSDQALLSKNRGLDRFVGGRVISETQVTFSGYQLSRKLVDPKLG